MTRTLPSAVVRACAVLGGLLWGCAAVYVLILILSGFVGWAAPNAYLTVLLVVAGLALNAALFRRADALKAPEAFGLLILSLALSTLVLGTLAYMAFDLGT